MTSQKHSVFLPTDIKPLIKGEIRELPQDSPQQSLPVTRGGVNGNASSTENMMESLRPLFSDNTYKNDKGQEFEFKILCGDKNLHERIQKEIRVAALIDKLSDSDESVEVETDINLTEDEILFAAVNTESHLDESVTGEVQVKLRVVEPVNIEPPYRVQFLLTSETDEQNMDLELEQTDEHGGTGRGTVQLQSFTHSFDLALPKCKEPILHVITTRLRNNSSVGGRLHWNGGSIPRNLENGRELYRPVKLNQEKTFKGPIAAHKYTLSVKLSGQGEYTIEGDYIDP